MDDFLVTNHFSFIRRHFTPFLREASRRSERAFETNQCSLGYQRNTREKSIFCFSSCSPFHCLRFSLYFFLSDFLSFV